MFKVNVNQKNWRVIRIVVQRLHHLLADFELINNATTTIRSNLCQQFVSLV